MAQSEKPAGRKVRLEQSPLFETIDARNTSALTCAQGLLAKGPRQGTWQLFVTPQLNESYVFDDEAVAHSEPVAANDWFGESTRVWFKSDASVTYVRSESRQIQASFLKGGLTARLTTPGLSGAGIAQGQAVFRTHYDFCTMAWCHSFLFCPNSIDNCPTRNPVVCGE